MARLFKFAFVLFNEPQSFMVKAHNPEQAREKLLTFLQEYKQKRHLVLDKIAQESNNSEDPLACDNLFDFFRLDAKGDYFHTADGEHYKDNLIDLIKVLPIQEIVPDIVLVTH